MLRHADPARDAAACAAIYAPYVEGRGTSFEESPPSPAELSARIERISASHAWLVDEIDGEVAGFAYASPHRERQAYRWTAETSVYVGETHQRNGVGRSLYTGLLALLSRQRMHVVCAGITLPNDASVALHEALGFELVGTYRQIGFKAGAWRDVSWWQRVLDESGADPPPEPLGPQRLG
jgi:phosphinothricin acetyltransferase